MYTNEEQWRFEMSKASTTTLSDRLEEAKVARKEAKAAREKEKAEKQRIKNKKTEAQIRVREQQGGAGMRIVFFDKPAPKGKGKR